MKRPLFNALEEDFLRAHYADSRTEDLARVLARTVHSVYAKAHTMGLLKSAAFLASPEAGRITAGSRMGKDTRFQSGHTTWNKGMKGLQIGGVETRFKKGHRAGKALENYQPVGATRINKDGILQVKVNDDMPLQRRWKAVHAVLWEEANGAIPAGHLVVFRNGNRHDIRLENLECITRAENMRRNNVHQLPKEVAQLVMLRGALVRKINARSNE